MIAYDRTGRGFPVVLVDGALAHRGHMGGRPLATALAGDFTVVAYDRRGRGESGDTQPYDVAREIEDLDALIAAVGAPVCLYGFSSGAVLALRAAAALGSRRVVKLAVHEPPFGGDDERARRELRAYRDEIATLIREGRNGDAVTAFLQDMLPPDVLEGIQQSPAWGAMQAVAPTLVYDNDVLGDGAVPAGVAAEVTVPTLIIDGSESPDFKDAAADALARAMPNARRRTLAGQTTLVPPNVLGPVLREFFR